MVLVFITSSSACKKVLRSSLCRSSWCEAILLTNTSKAWRLISINSALKRNFSALERLKLDTTITLEFFKLGGTSNFKSSQVLKNVCKSKKWFISPESCIINAECAIDINISYSLKSHYILQAKQQFYKELILKERKSRLFTKIAVQIRSNWK